MDDTLDKFHSKSSSKPHSHAASSTGDSDTGEGHDKARRASVHTSSTQSATHSAEETSPRNTQSDAMEHSASELDTPPAASAADRRAAGAAHGGLASSRTRGEAGPASEVMGHGKKSRSIHHRGGNKAQPKQQGKRLAGREDDVQLTDADGVVVVVPHLPVMLSHYTNGAWRVSWDEEHLLSQKKPSVHFGGEMKLRVTFVGIPNVHVPEEEQEAVRAALAPFRCKPVFLPQDVKRDAVTGFCKDTLWPLFHNVVDVYGAVPTRWWNRARQSTRWQAYMELNRRFADVVVEAYNEGDLVWIHDYHLLLLPSVLARRRLRSSNISLFLHAPFPSSEIFRTLSVRDDLLRGMLNADHIGFHLFEYARHFLACCRRILGLEHSIQGGGRIALHSQGRDVVITVCHAGVEPIFISHRLATDEVRVFQEELCRMGSLPKGHGVLVPTPTPLALDDDRDELASPTPQPAMHTPSVDGSATSTPNSISSAPRDTEDPAESTLKVVVGLDSLERLKGLPLKLVAFERFLEENLEWVPHVRLMQFGVFDKSREADCRETQEEVEFLVRRINARFGHMATGKRSGVRLTLPARAGGAAGPVNTSLSSIVELPPGGSGSIPPTASSEEHSLPQQPHSVQAATSSHADQECGSLAGPIVFYCRRQGGMSLSERLALYNLGSVYFSSAFRDGLNLSPLEFVYASERTQGVVVVSEFSSCSRMLPGAIRINPWKVSAVANALARAVSMHTGEATARRQANLACLSDNTTSLWAERVLLDLKRASQVGGHRTYMGYGLGLNFRQLGFESNFSALNVENMIAAYRRTSRRLFLFDYSGTLLSRAFKVDKVAATKQQAYAHGLLDDPSSAFLLSEPPLSSAVKTSLRALASDPRNTVVILSGKERTVLETAFVDCPELCLAAEHGFYYRFGVAPGPLTSSALPLGVLIAGASAPRNTAREWLQLGEHFDDSWMDLVAAYMEGYAARTNGTYVSRKSSSMVWHFADADKEFGRLQAKELVDHLTNLLKHFPVDVFQGTAYIEVRPRGVSKGAIAQHFVDLLEGRVQAGQATLMEQTGTSGAGAQAEAAQAAAEAAVSCKLQRRHRAKPGTTGATARRADAADTDAPSIDFMDGDTTDAGTPRGAIALFDALSPAPAPAPRPGSEGGSATPGKASTAARRTKRVDFVFCVGDDNADESMFMMLGDRWKGLLAQRGRAKERRRGPLGSSLAFTASTGVPTAEDTKEYAVEERAAPGGTPLSDSSTARDSPADSLGGVDSELQVSTRQASSLGPTLSRSRSHGKHIGRRAPGLRASMGLGPVGFMEGSSVLRGDAAGSVASLSSAGSASSQNPQAHKTPAMPHQFTVIVGKKPSAAQYFVEDTTAVEDCLRALSKVATRINTNRSMTDLNSLAGSSSSTAPRLTFSASHAALPALGLPQVPSYVDFAEELRGPSLGSDAQTSSLVPRVLPLQISALPAASMSSTASASPRPMLVSSMSLPLLQEAMFPPSPVPGRAHTSMYGGTDMQQMELPTGALGTAVPQLTTGAAALPGARSDGRLHQRMGQRTSTQDNLVEFLGMDEDQPPAF